MFDALKAFSRRRTGLATTIANVVVGALLLTEPASAQADDVTAAARGVVRIIVVAKNYDDSSVTLGSGFAVSPHHIVTNAHVIEAAQNPYADSLVAIVPAEGNRAVEGRIIAADEGRDLALVEVEPRLEPLAIYSGPVESGQHMAALGYPGNVDMATVRSMYDLITPTSPVRSEGSISSQRQVNGLPALLHTAAIARGNSGGPLVDECGRVVGVNTYTTNSESGDAPFGFAVVSQELMSFLRDHSETFQQVGTACITMAEQQQKEQQAGEAARRAEANAQQRAAAETQQRTDAEKARLEDERANHAVGAGLLALLTLIAGAFATALFMKDRTRAAGIAGSVAALGLVGAGYEFFSRPSLEIKLSPLTNSASAQRAELRGQLLCRVQLDRSRVTVSSTDDLAMSWGSSGCMNGRTQYVRDGDLWRKVLVPNGSETVFVQEFIPASGEYRSIRYHLPQSDMERLRAIRGTKTANTCAADSLAFDQLSATTQQLVSALPSAPNERIVYKCSAS